MSLSGPRSGIVRLPHIWNACIDKEAKDKVRAGIIRKSELWSIDKKSSKKETPLNEHLLPFWSLPLCIHQVR
jgi:hypothetical protein